MTEFFLQTSLEKSSSNPLCGNSKDLFNSHMTYLNDLMNHVI